MREPSPSPACASALRASASSSAPASPLTPTAPTRRSPSNAATPPWKNVKNGSKLASSPGLSLTFSARSRVERASLRAAVYALRCAFRRVSGAAPSIVAAATSSPCSVRDEHGDRPGGLSDHRLDDRQRLLVLHRDTLRDVEDDEPAERNRDRDARVRLHGEGPLERVPEAPVHRVAAARSSRSSSRSRAGTRRPWRTPRFGTATSAGRRTGTTSSPIPRSACSTTAAPTRSTPSRRSPPRRRASTCSARSRSAATPSESYEIWQRVAATGVKHLCGFNYRFVPAVRLARELIDAGELGEIRHFRGRYLQDWGDDPSLDTWRFQPDEAGSGALGDLGTHVVDLARFLAGEISTVSGLVRTFLPGRQVDDALEAAVEFEQGASGRSRRRGSPSAGATPSSGRSTARRDRSRSTWSG